ncbi:MAG: Uma2 family endonuclease, partial [Gemmatimonadota bacterium]
ELIEGELLVTPAPRLIHQRAVSELFGRIKLYVARHQLGEVLTAPADLDFRRGFSAQPDLFVVPLFGDRKPREWRECDVPTFIAEVQSPSTARYDRKVKRPAFQRAGVADYWIVDPDSRIVEQWQPLDVRPDVALDRAMWQPDPRIPAFELDLAEYFAEVWGEGPRGSREAR